MTTPAITVLMPVHNAGVFLEDSVTSILTQSFPDFELLIVDDASTDTAIQNLRCLADSRLRVERLKSQCGIVSALNYGLERARGAFIARMDADDIAEVNRLEVQINFLLSHSSIGLCGSDFTPFGDGPNSSWIHYHKPEDIRIALLFENPICHPTVMFRRALIDGRRYPSTYPHAEEYALWLRLAAEIQMANISPRLLRYRTHGGQVSHQKCSEQCRSIDRLQLEQLATLGLHPSANELKLHHALGSAFYPSPRLKHLLSKWIEKLISANELTRLYQIDLFQRQLQQRFLRTLVRTQAALGSMPLHRKFRWQAQTWLRSFQ